MVAGVFMRTLGALLAGLVLVVAQSSPASSYGQGYHYAGVGDFTQIATGIWAWFETANPATPAGTHVAHYVGGYRYPNYAGGTEWAQTGWLKRACCEVKPRWYIEYFDYAGSYGRPMYEEAAGTWQHSVWGDASGGSDGIGTYFYKFVNLKAAPGGSPTWIVYHRHLWHHVQAWGETYVPPGGSHPPIGPATYQGVTRAVWDQQTYWATWGSQPLPCDSGDCTDSPYGISMYTPYNYFRVFAGP